MGRLWISARKYGAGYTSSDLSFEIIAINNLFAKISVFLNISFVLFLNFIVS
jgi:hypothetical protein